MNLFADGDSEEVERYYRTNPTVSLARASTAGRLGSRQSKTSDHDRAERYHRGKCTSMISSVTKDKGAFAVGIESRRLRHTFGRIAPAWRTKGGGGRRISIPRVFQREKHSRRAGRTLAARRERGRIQTTLEADARPRNPKADGTDTILANPESSSILLEHSISSLLSRRLSSAHRIAFRSLLFLFRPTPQDISYSVSPCLSLSLILLTETVAAARLTKEHEVELIRTDNGDLPLSLSLSYSLS